MARHRWLYPVGLLWQLGATLRRLAYSWGLQKRFQPDLPVICIGNLAVGGTGKTPHVIWVCQQLLAAGLHPVVLTRGYGRTSTGLVSSHERQDAAWLGDEPALIYQTLAGKVPIVCAGPRVEGYKYIRETFPDCDVVIMDDGFQHLAIQPTLSLVLSRFDEPFFTDYPLPAGRLREARSQVGRAQAVIFTSTPADVTRPQRDYMRSRVGKYARVHLPVFFSQSKTTVPLPPGQPVVLVSGVANNIAVCLAVDETNPVLFHVDYGDHHHYTDGDVKRIVDTCQKVPHAALVCTPKDAGKLAAFPELQAVPLHVLGHDIDLGNGADALAFMLVNHCRVLHNAQKPAIG